jgi:hypothetical protein
MIPDDEPWWMVRQLQGDGYGGSSQALPCTCPLADAERDDRETEEPTDFRPFGYEW